MAWLRGALLTYCKGTPHHPESGMVLKEYLTKINHFCHSVLTMNHLHHSLTLHCHIRYSYKFMVCFHLKDGKV